MKYFFYKVCSRRFVNNRKTFIFLVYSVVIIIMTTDFETKVIITPIFFFNTDVTSRTLT